MDGLEGIIEGWMEFAKQDVEASCFAQKHGLEEVKKRWAGTA
jgi:hypothetical protein